MELSWDKVSVCKEKFKVVWMEFDTVNCKSDENSSLHDEDSLLLLSLKHVLHVILFLNLSICCACKDSTQNFSKIQDKISAAFYCWNSEKLDSPDVLTAPCKNCKNWPKGALEDLKHNSNKKRCNWRQRVVTESEI